MEVRETRRKLLRIMKLVNCRMLEAKDLKELKEQNVQRRLQAVKVQVKTPTYKDLWRFRQHQREDILASRSYKHGMGYTGYARGLLASKLIGAKRGPSRMQYTAGGTSWAWSGWKSQPDTS